MWIKTDKIENFAGIIARWMDGSLFFRGLVALMNFMKNICSNSLIGQAFVGDESHLSITTHRSKFMRLAGKILNGLPKPFRSPTALPPKADKFLKGSWLLSNLLEGVGAPLPIGFRSAKPGDFSRWMIFTLPALGLAVVLLGTPILPTMMLGMLLVPILLFTLLSRWFAIEGITAFFLIFIILSIVVGVMSLAPRSSIPIALLTSIYVASAMAIMAIATTRHSVDFYILIFIAGAGITGLIGLYQVLVGYTSDLWLDMEIHAAIRNRVVSTFDNPNVFATYLLLVIPIAAAAVIYFKNIFLKICAGGATALLLGNLMLTYTRGAYVALPLAVIVFVLIIEKRLVVLLAAFLPVVPIILPPTIRDRMFSILNFSDSSTVFRMSIWQGSLRMAQDFWLTGVGQGLEAYHAVYPYYALMAAGTLHSHNLYLQILVATGIGGLFLFIAIVACFFRAHANFLRREKAFRLRVMSAAMVAAMVGFLAQGMFDYNFFNFSVVLAFYMFVGIGVAFTRANTPVVTPFEDNVYD